VATPFIFHREKKLSVQEALMIAQILGVNIEGMATLSLHIDESLNMTAYGRGDSPNGDLPSFASPNNWHPNWGAAIRDMQESAAVVVDDAPLPEIVVDPLAQIEDMLITQDEPPKSHDDTEPIEIASAELVSDEQTQRSFLGIEELAIKAGLKMGLSEDNARTAFQRALGGEFMALDALGISIKKVKDEHERLVAEGYRENSALYTAIYQELQKVTEA
jgi:hypothetical protein